MTLEAPKNLNHCEDLAYLSSKNDHFTYILLLLLNTKIIIVNIASIVEYLSPPSPLYKNDLYEMKIWLLRLVSIFYSRLN